MGDVSMGILVGALAIILIVWCISRMQRESGNLRTALQGQPVPRERQTGCGEFVLLFAVFAAFIAVALATWG